MLRFAFFVSLVGACAPAAARDTTEVLVAQGTDASAIDANTATVLSSLIAGTSQLDLSTRAFAESCVGAITNANATTLRFAGCAAPNGIAGTVDGELVVAKTWDGSVLHVEVSSSQLDVGAVHVTQWTATGDVTVSNGVRTMIWQSHSEGTMISGGVTRSFVRDVSPTTVKSSDVPQACVSVDGTSTGTFVTDGVATTVGVSLVSYRRCGSKCPDAGSQVRRYVDDRQRIEVSYLGGDRATYTNQQGQTFPFVPACAR